MLVKEYSLNPIRISKNVFSIRPFCRNITQEELVTDISCSLLILRG